MIGIDLVALEDVEAALDAHGEDYLRRVYLPEEVDACRRPSGEIDPRRLAGRFAAKEAVAKALGAGAEAIGPRDVAVAGAGPVRVRLAGAAAALARQRGVEEVSVSISRQAGMALAVAIGGRRADPAVTVSRVAGYACVVDDGSANA